MPVDYVYRRPLVRGLVRAYDLFGSLFLRSKSPSSVRKPRHVCFIVLHQIGDAVVSLPTIHAIMDAASGARFSAIFGSVTAPLVRGSLPGVEITEFDADWHLIVQMTKGSGADMANDAKARFVAQIQELRPDVAIVFNPDLIANRLLAKSGVPWRIGFANAGGGFWLTNPLEMPESGHQAERSFALAKEFCRAFEVECTEFNDPQLTASEQDRARALGVLKEAGVETSKVVCLHPFGRFPTKDWSIEGWQTVIAWLLDQGYQPAILGGPGDEARPFLQENPGVVDLSGRLTLPETSALLTEALLFIGVDSGPAHIAGAAGCPVVSVFSVANSVERWSPRGLHVAVITGAAPDAPGIGTEPKEIPTGLDENPYTSLITPEQVIAAAQALLRDVGGVQS